MSSPRSFRLVRVPVAELPTELAELEARGWTVARRSVDKFTGEAVVLISRPVPAALPAALEAVAPVVGIHAPSKIGKAPAPVEEVEEVEDPAPSSKPSKPKPPRKPRPPRKPSKGNA